MKIICIANSISENSDNVSLVEWAKRSKLELIVGATYTVIAISNYLDTPFYYILTDNKNDYPLSFPYTLFNIVDPTVSQFWNTSLKWIKDPNNLNIANGDIISFREWSVNKDRFYENLLDGSKRETEIFKYYQDKILTEQYNH